MIRSARPSDLAAVRDVELSAATVFIGTHMDFAANHAPNHPVDLSNIVLDMHGVPPFHQRVYALARGITPGETLTYGEIALRLGDSGLARAVGQALGHNPFAPVVPCHRVLAAGGRAGGFSANGGVDTKLRLLQIERARINGPGLFDAPAPAPTG